MAKPDTIVFADIPDSELEEILREIDEEAAFDVVSKIRSDSGTWTIKLKRRAD